MCFKVYNGSIYLAVTGELQIVNQYIEVTRMALLSTEDVLNKRFSITKFREGYDQDEVDDFLDEIVETLASLQDEREELLAKLEQAQSGVAPVVEQTVTAVEETVAEPEATEPEPAPAPVQPVAQPEPEAATGVLLLAQKVHDEYVNNARQEADRIVTEARELGAKIVKDAEDVSARTMEKLSSDRAEVEKEISRLEGFEADYRSQIRGHLEGLLKDLNSPLEV